MQSLRRPMRLLMLCGLGLAASGCGHQVRIQPAFPPVADMAVEPKPVPPPEIVTSAQAAAAYDIALESWGERGWLTVARICRWAKEQGADVSCPAPQ